MNYRFLQLLLILLIGVFYELSSVTIRDVCQMTNIKRMSTNYVYLSFLPRGGLKSGSHTRFNSTNETACFEKCCEIRTCNVALHIGTICFTFECNLKNFEDCWPKKVHKKKFQKSKFFLLRSPIILNRVSGDAKAKRSQMKVTSVSNNSVTRNSNKNITIHSDVNDTTTISPKPMVRILKVDIGFNRTLIMPTNSVTLVAKVHDDVRSTYEYQWNILSKPTGTNSGKMDTTKTKEMKLTELIIGVYEVQVEVHGNNTYGKANVFVFVKPAKKLNLPPVAKIVPNNQTVQLPNNVILDGTKSTDDDKVVSYNWELIKGPLEGVKNIKNEESMLNLEHLSAGNYTFKLTVKDSTGASSSDMANLTVLAEKDDPPRAEPGKNVIVELPLKFVILNGSLSSDDKKIVSYQWTKKSDGLTADIQGVREPILNLTNLQEGTYTFNLKVTDSAGQSSDKDIQVFVKPRTNSAPVAKASVTDDKSVTVRLPASEAVLNGSLSTDDEQIVRYQWMQIEGKPLLNLINPDKPIAYVDDLKIGLFKFNLTVFDKEKLSSSDTVTLRINESKNQKPKARYREPPKYYHFSTNLFKIDGSNSWDDVEITRYKWTREDDSLAVGEILENSHSSPVLLLTNLLPGLYKFKLQVFDIEHKTDSTVVSFEVHKSKFEKSLVELQFLCSLPLFTESKKNIFLNNIQLIVQKKIGSDTSKVVIHLVQLDKFTFANSVTIVFYVTRNKETKSSSVKTATIESNMKTNATLSERKQKKSVEIPTGAVVVEEIFIDALKVVDSLSIIRHNSISMEYQVVRVETFVCQNNCSHHGKCNEVTKLCECETFWTSSYFRERFGDGRPNCDWSIIYLSILFGILIILIFLLCWFFLWIRQRKCKAKKSSKIRKHQYMKLDNHDYDGRINCKVPKSLGNGVKSRTNYSEKSNESLLNSDSSMSSDDEETTTFINTSHYHHPVKKTVSSSSVTMATINGGDTLKTS